MHFSPYSGLGTNKPLVATAAMPSTSMKIYRGESVDGRVAESVKIGDPLTMVISIGKLKNNNFGTQFGNFGIFLSFRFYVKSILDKLEVLKLPLKHFLGL